MLADPAPEIDGNIAAENLHAVQAIYFAHQLDNMRAFEVVDRLVELFQQGLLPLRSGEAGRLLKRYATADRLSARQRQQLYARALGVAADAADAVHANPAFHSLWLRLIASVTLFEAQQGAANAPAQQGASSAAAGWRAARALAANASAHGAGLAGAVERLSVDANLLRAVLQAPEIRKAFGERDMWQVIEQVNTAHLGGARNVARHRQLAQAGSAILQWLARHAAALNKPAVPTPFPDTALLDAVSAWLAAGGAEGAHTDATPTDCAALPSPSVPLWALAGELLRIMGVQALLGRRGRAADAAAATPAQASVALFCGPAGSGKTLGAHTLAAALSRDLVRVDLRQVVGRYIGETEKNLDAVLARVEQGGAVLLLDEADALFGKRTDVQDAHDRHADAQLNYLLQRLREHRGMVILESRAMPAGSGEAEGPLAGLSPVVHFPRAPDDA